MGKNKNKKTNDTHAKQEQDRKIKEEKEKQELEAKLALEKEEREREARNRKQKSKGKKGGSQKETKNKESKKKAPSTGYHVSDAKKTVSYVRENWKIIVLLVGFFGIVTFTKMREEMYSMYSMGAGQQVTEDLYSILEISKNSDMDQIKESFKKKAVELHPDKNPNCNDCHEKFSEVTKAYDVLIDPEAREHYDNTNTILKKIKSKTEELTNQNYERLVEETTDLWMIMVYLDSDELSKTFTNFWDEVAVKYPFVKFGRINFAKEKALVRRLPFRIEEIPFILSVDKHGHSDFLEYNYHRESKTPLMKFVRTSIGKHFKQPGVSGIIKALRSESEKPAIVYVSRSYMPTAYSYLGYKFDSMINIMATQFGEQNEVTAEAKNPNADYIIRLPKHLKYKDNSLVTVSFDSKHKRQEEAHMNMFVLSKYLMIPEIKRNSFNDFCKDHTVSENAESQKHSVCIIALKGDSNEKFEEIMEVFREEQNRLLPSFVEKITDMESDIFDSFRTIQFGYIDLNSNKAFKRLIEDKSPVKAPRVLIYISGQNKIQAFNNIDEVLDNIEDLVHGEYEGYIHFKKLSDSPKPFNMYLLPDHVTVCSLFIKALKGEFFSFLQLIIAGVLIVLAPKISNMSYRNMSIALCAGFFFKAVLVTIFEAIRAELF